MVGSRHPGACGEPTQIREPGQAQPAPQDRTGPTLMQTARLRGVSSLLSSFPLSYQTHAYDVIS